MKIVCPICEKAYDIPENRLSRPIVKAKCTGCEAVMHIHKEDGRVETGDLPAPDAVSEKRDSSISPEEMTDTPLPEEVEGPPAKREPLEIQAPIGSAGDSQTNHGNNDGTKDYMALGAFTIAVIAFFVIGYFGLKSIDWGTFSKPVKALEDIMAVIEKGGEEKDRKVPKKETKPKTKYQGHIEKAHQHFREKNYDEALKEYTQALKANPKSYAAFYWRAQLFVKRGELDRAISDFNMTLKLNPNYHKAYSTLGWAYNQVGKFEESIGSLDKFISSNPEDGWAYYQRGHSYYKKGDLERALRDAKQACELGYKDGCKVHEAFMRQKNRNP